MVDEDDEEGSGSIHRIDTVPPPDGEADAYNGPTRVGAMASLALAELMKSAGLDGSPDGLPVPGIDAQPRPASASPAAPATVAAPATTTRSPLPDVLATPAFPDVVAGPLPQLYDANDEGSDPVLLPPPAASELVDAKRAPPVKASRARLIVLLALLAAAVTALGVVIERR